MEEPEKIEVPIPESKIKKIGKRLWKFTKRFFLVFGILVLVYFFSAYILSRITVEGKNEKNATIEKMRVNSSQKDYWILFLHFLSILLTHLYHYFS